MKAKFMNAMLTVAAAGSCVSAGDCYQTFRDRMSGVQTREQVYTLVASYLDCVRDDGWAVDPSRVDRWQPADDLRGLEGACSAPREPAVADGRVVRPDVRGLPTCSAPREPALFDGFVDRPDTRGPQTCFGPREPGLADGLVARPDTREPGSGSPACQVPGGSDALRLPVLGFNETSTGYQEVDAGGWTLPELWVGVAPELWVGVDCPPPLNRVPGSVTVRVFAFGDGTGTEVAWMPVAPDKDVEGQFGTVEVPFDRLPHEGVLVLEGHVDGVKDVQYAMPAYFNRAYVCDGVKPGGPAGDACPADFTGDGGANVDDVLAFLAAFGASLPPADMNGDAAFNVDDVLLFLEAFSDGCPGAS